MFSSSTLTPKDGNGLKQLLVMIGLIAFAVKLSSNQQDLMLYVQPTTSLSHSRLATATIPTSATAITEQSLASESSDTNKVRTRSDTVPTNKKPTRRTTQGAGILPNILLIGTQKSGSTAIAAWLVRNGVCVGSSAKEMRFFHSTDRYKLGSQYYQRQYRNCATQKKPWILDGTPETLQFPERVYETYNASATSSQIANLKIILTIREPMARELSMYNHMISQQGYKNDETLQNWGILREDNKKKLKSFEEFVDTMTIPNLSSDTHRSAVAHYSKYLQRWFQLFDPQQLLVLHYETDVKTGYAKNRIVQFFNNTNFRPRMLNKPFPSINSLESPFKVKRMPCHVRDKMDILLQPLNEELYQLLNTTTRPTMEQQPFPKFLLPDCQPRPSNDVASKIATTSTNGTATISH